MKVMVMVKATEGSEAGQMPTEQLMADMTAFNEELVKAGIMQAGEGLKPTSEGYRVRFSGKNRTVTDGPFPETNELVAGFWLWNVDSMEQALEWVKRCPNPMTEDSEIEVRPLYSMEDFIEADPDGSIREREAALNRAISMQQANVQPYLYFGGRCEEAIEFYLRIPGAQCTVKMLYNQCPEPIPEGMIPEGFEDKVMHAEFTVGGSTIMASDGCADAPGFQGIRLTLNVATEADADLAFGILADGGNIEMPLGKTFWSPRFGMVTDKFGLEWMVNVCAPESRKPGDEA